MSAVLALTGLGPFIWTSYALTLIGVGGLIVWALMARRAARARLDLIQTLNAEDSYEGGDLPPGDAPGPQRTGHSL